MPQNPKKNNVSIFSYLLAVLRCFFSGRNSEPKNLVRVNDKYGQKIEISREKFVLPDLTSTHFSFATKLCTTKLIDER